MNRRDFCLFALAGFPTLALASVSCGTAKMSIDTHAHIFLLDLPMDPGRRYTPPRDATAEAYLAMLDRLGSTQGVLVQPSFLGTDNSFMLAATAANRAWLRAIVVVQPDIGEDELDHMAGQGAVGVRLNLIGRPDPDLTSKIWRRHIERLADRGWQVEIQVESFRLKRLLGPLTDSGIKVVIDHFGRPDAAFDEPDSGFRHLLDAASTGHVWVKLSAPYRLGPGVEGYALARKVAAPLLKSFGPERLMWGSDWPHTEFEQSVSTSACLEALETWVPDGRARRQILSRTPAALFGFVAKDCVMEEK